jgi:hypothetical protein
MCHLCVLFVLLDKRWGGSDSEGFQLSSLSCSHGFVWQWHIMVVLWVWVGVELSVVSSTGVKWCNSV